MNILNCEYGKYESIDADRLSTSKHVKDGGNFVLESIPIIGWSVDDDLNRSPILINGEKHINPAIYDVEHDRWYWGWGSSGAGLSLLKTLIKEAASYE